MDIRGDTLTRRNLLRLAVGAPACILVSAAPVSSLASVAPDWRGQVQTAIDLARAYVRDKYDPIVGLLREAATEPTRRNWFWLFNDNAIAAWALPQVGEADLATQLHTTLTGYELESPSPYYHHDRNGLQEVLWDVAVAWPPRAYQYVDVVLLEGSKQVRFEHNYPVLDNPNQGVFLDWAEYANLALYAALNASTLGDTREAARRCDRVIATFNGRGFPDRTYQVDGLYETFKLALALHIGLRLRRLTSRQARDLVAALLVHQQRSKVPGDAASAARYGGFYTHYDDITPNRGDTNTETTCLATVALQAYVSSAAPGPAPKSYAY